MIVIACGYCEEPFEPIEGSFDGLASRGLWPAVCDRWRKVPRPAMGRRANRSAGGPPEDTVEPLPTVAPRLRREHKPDHPDRSKPTGSNRATVERISPAAL